MGAEDPLSPGPHRHSDHVNLEKLNTELHRATNKASQRWKHRKQPATCTHLKEFAVKRLCGFSAIYVRV